MKANNLCFRSAVWIAIALLLGRCLVACGGPARPATPTPRKAIADVLDLFFAAEDNWSRITREDNLSFADKVVAVSDVLDSVIDIDVSQCPEDFRTAWRQLRNVVMRCKVAMLDTLDQKPSDEDFYGGFGEHWSEWNANVENLGRVARTYGVDWYDTAFLEAGIHSPEFGLNAQDRGP